MPDASAASTTRRVSIGRFTPDAAEPRRGPRTVRRDAGMCMCAAPITDDAAGTIGVTTIDDDDELCWRCHRPISED